MAVNNGVLLVTMAMLGLVGANYHQTQQGRESAGIPFFGNSQSCDPEVMRGLTAAVQSLFPLKDEVMSMQKQLTVMHEASVKNKKYLESLEANAGERSALRSDVARLRDELTQCSTKAREARSQHQIECVAKIAALSAETQREVAGATDHAEKMVAQLTELNQTTLTEITALRNENEVLRAQLEVLKRSKAMACAREGAGEEGQQNQDQDDAETAGTARSGAAWYASDPELGAAAARSRRTKPSPGKSSKPESAISKIPASSYKHSCKGYLEPTAPAAPMPQETSIRVSNRQYIIAKEPATWGEAWRACRARGMWVLTLETEAEQQQLEPHITQMHHTPTKYWLFARKPQGSAWFSWECAESSEPEPWRLPTVARAGAGAAVRCGLVEMHNPQGTAWLEDSCEQKHHYICRKLVTEC